MEIPNKYKKLYRHWQKHTENKTTPLQRSKLNQKVLKDIETFATERMNIWEKKEKGKNPPHTKDEILQRYRFCNIYRELDRQTIEIHSMLKGLRNNFPLWLLNMAYARFMCKPQTLQKTGFLSFDENSNREVFNTLLAIPKPKYGAAYVFPISVIQKTETPTREEFFCFYLPKRMEEIAGMIEGFDNISVAEAVKNILPKFGFNFRFHWTEILIDVAYQYPEKINLFAEFPIGPGSEPTMKRLSKAEPSKTCLALTSHEIRGFPYLTFNNKIVHLSAENWEGIGCEFRKYSNLKQGKGRVRKYSM